MTATQESPSPRVELIPANREQQPVLANLLQLYMHDFGEFFPLDLDPSGRFDYPHLPLYWSEPGRFPFLIHVDGRLAGLVFVKRGSGIVHGEEIWDMAEFFIVRAYRRQGIGVKVAHQVWAKFPGWWEVRVMESNRAAVGFWLRAITAFVGAPVEPVTNEKDGMRWLVFAFESEPLING